MFDAGENLLRENYKKWPLPVRAHFHFGHYFEQDTYTPPNDEITSYNATKELCDKTEGFAVHRAMLTYPNGFHELVHEPAHREKVIEDMVAFVEARL
ncbi:hypothetical protein FB45DRAFT_1034524 [Roridomyces roridus]|uniref:Uncharacterized protein n=1 Tax=Roridomyces roridus TaxID=1738132 RepID=A0AAD7FFG9_9AGAR|nr:hypothetical protein FB45DRAFT_1034524 [Roridomyces roridus]